MPLPLEKKTLQRFLPKKAIYPGSFDPITNGHLDILDRSLPFFPEIIIVIANSRNKNVHICLEKRIEIIKKIARTRKGVKVDYWPGLMMDYAKKHNISAIIRGLRATSDFEYEFMMASMNKELNPCVETLFMMTSKNLYFVSSSMVKELFHYGANIAPYVPKEVLHWFEGK